MKTKFMFMGFLIAIFAFFSFTNDNDTVIIMHGEKYYKTGVQFENDTIENPGNITIIKTKVILYDNMKRKKIKK